jgi:hypothetical protein
MFKKRESSSGFTFDYVAVTTNTFGNVGSYAGAFDEHNDIGTRTAVIGKLIETILSDYKKNGWDSGFLLAMPEFLFRPKSGSYSARTLGTLSGTLINMITRADREGRGLYVLGSILVAERSPTGSPMLLNVVPILSAVRELSGKVSYKCSYLYKHNVSGIDYLTESGSGRSSPGDRIIIGGGVGKDAMPSTYARGYDAAVTGELAKLGFVSTVPSCIFDGIDGGYSLGIEVCLDHAYGLLATECGTGRGVGAHLVVSCGMELGPHSADVAGTKSACCVPTGGVAMLCDGMATGKIRSMERKSPASAASAFKEKAPTEEIKFSLDAKTLTETFGLDASRVSADEAAECFPGGFTARIYRDLQWCS